MKGERENVIDILLEHASLGVLVHAFHSSHRLMIHFSLDVDSVPTENIRKNESFARWLLRSIHTPEFGCVALFLLTCPKETKENLSKTPKEMQRNVTNTHTACITQACKTDPEQVRTFTECRAKHTEAAYLALGI